MNMKSVLFTVTGMMKVLLWYQIGRILPFKILKTSRTPVRINKFTFIEKSSTLTIKVKSINSLNE